MRAVTTLRHRLKDATSRLDRRLERLLWQAVDALLRSRVLQLTRLGWYLTRQTSPKHRIKAIDRLLGNATMLAASPQIYRALAQLLIASASTVVVLVDWTQLRGSTYALLGAVPIGGRAIPILSQVYRHAKSPKPRMHRRFMDELAQVLPENCTPILVTDAGVRASWIQEVQARGWHYVVRLRHRTCVRPAAGGPWRPNKHLHALAGPKAKDLGDWLIGRERAGARVTARLVIARRPRRRRHLKGRSGKVLRGGKSVSIRKQHREPWLLATSLSREAATVVALYATRMQIEETFRDAKSDRFGLGFGRPRTECPERLAVLFLIATLALASAVLVGLAALAHHDWWLRQAKRGRRPTLSVVQLGLRILTMDPHYKPSAGHIAEALKELIDRVAASAFVSTAQGP
jgi:hypothetical protein